MISVTEAKTIVSANVAPLSAISLPIEQAANHVLAAELYAICDIPTFPQSAMDGYALKFEDRHQPLTVIGEMAAGVSAPLTIDKGEVTRIFTGAPLPAGADTVVMQEKIILIDGKLVIKDENLSFGLHVRNQGAEVEKNALAIEKGVLLTPAAIGYLAQIGITEVSVYPMPSVAIIVTGKELQQPGKPLRFGQVYEANSYALTAALNKANITDIQIFTAEDDLQVLTNVLKFALSEKDAVILTGGVSVGDYDFVVQAAQNCKVTQLFHKVRQKPGKPLYVGKKGDQLVFGLPGNPSSVLNCFYNYALPALHQLSNKTNSVKEIEASLGADYVKAAGLTHFLKGNYRDGIATPLNAQESFRLSSFAEASCLICLPAEQEIFNAGATVTIFLLP